MINKNEGKDEEEQYDEETAEKFAIIKDVFSRASFFDFYYKCKFYRADAGAGTVRFFVFESLRYVIFTFKNYDDFMNSTFLSDTPFKELVKDVNFRITGF